MILLILFAFLAGIFTILSPCILPILPIVLSGALGSQGVSRAKPLGIIAGFILSFTFFTLFLSTIVKFSGISSDWLRLFSVLVIALFGLSLLLPHFQLWMEIVFSRLAQYLPQSQNEQSFSLSRTGFFGGLFIGLSLGLLWTPCVGPILASVIALAVSGGVTLDAVFITLAYSAGTAIPMFFIMVAGQNVLRKVPWLLTNSGAIQKFFGVLMVLTAGAIFFNFDRQFQMFVLNTFPNYGTGLTRIEDIALIQDALKGFSNTEVEKADLGKPMFTMNNAKGPMASEIKPGGEWFNTSPLELNQFRGKVVLIDFWTYSCINCQRTLPYLKNWWQKYRDQGLVIIGVHSPEFEFEKKADNVKKALQDFGITYPVVQDNDFATWLAYNNRYWPAKYLIDKNGVIRYSHFGEGDYDETEGKIQQLLKETGASLANTQIANPSYDVYAKTPELYLGYGRMEFLTSPEQVLQDAVSAYSAPTKIEDNTFAFKGNWEIMKEYSNAKIGSELQLNFDSKEVFLVMRPKDSAVPGKVEVYLDDKPISEINTARQSVVNNVVVVSEDNLYKLVNLASPGRHMLKLKFLDSNVEVYAFTFG